MSPLESWVTDWWIRSVDFLWTFLIICSQVALLLNRSTLLPVTLKKCCINTRIVTFLPHTSCVSSWIMGEGQKEKIYWLLMHFPDKLLTSCTSIEQVNLPSSHIGKMYCINTGVVTFLTHILCVSSCIMVEGRMEKIYWLLMNFPDKLLTSCTYIEQVNLPSSSIGKMLYQHRDSDIPNTHIMCLLLNHGWGTDGKDLLTSYELSW
jgi:hypothetical protein